MKKILLIALVFVFIFLALEWLGAISKKVIDPPEDPNEIVISNDPNEINKEQMEIAFVVITKNRKQERLSETESVFPPIWPSYRESIGFRRYYEEMTNRGAVYFFYSHIHSDWVKIDFKRKQLQPFDITTVGQEYVDPPNCLRDEPALADIVRDAKAKENIVYLAKTNVFVSKFHNILREHLVNSGNAIKSIVGIKGIYEIRGNQLYLNINKIALKDKGEIGVAINVKVPE